MQYLQKAQMKNTKKERGEIKGGKKRRKRGKKAKDEK